MDRDVHAFLFVAKEEAIEQGHARSTGRSKRGEKLGRLAGITIAVKDNICVRGMPATCASKILEGFRPPYDATVVERIKAAGRRHHRQDEHGRVRNGEHDPVGRIRADEEPMEPRTGPRRVVGRKRGGCRREHGHPRARLRHGRLCQVSCQLLFCPRAEADLRRGQQVRPHSLREQPGADRAVSRGGSRT